MRKRYLALVIVSLLFFSGGIWMFRRLPKEPSRATLKSVMKLTSPAFPHEGGIPVKYTCDAENVSPPLSLTDVPEGAKSLALIVDDPDAPRGDWVHWTVWDIAPTTREIPEGTAPAGATQGTTDFGTTGYGGPCPPSGTHKYKFTLYALDAALDIPPSSAKADVERAMTGHILASTILVGTYARR